MKTVFENKCMVTCTNNDRIVEAEVDNFLKKIPRMFLWLLIKSHEI